MGVQLIGGERAAKLLNQTAREAMKEKILRDILVDISVCEIEGWDKTEYIQDLKKFINSIGE